MAEMFKEEPHLERLLERGGGIKKGHQAIVMQWKLVNGTHQ